MGGGGGGVVSREGSDEAANVMLKLLEEPPGSTTIVLTSSERGALLPTIRPRVVNVRVAPLPRRDVEVFLADPVVADAMRHACRDIVFFVRQHRGKLAGSGNQIRALLDEAPVGIVRHAGVHG